MWTREDDIANGRFRPISAHALKAGFDQSGKLTAWQHRIAVDRVGAYMDPVRYQMAGGKDFIAMLGADLKGYDVPHQLVEQLYRDTGVRTNPLRGISFLANRFATESFIDEIARKRGVDPLAYHLELLKGTPRAIKVVERVAQMAEWGKKREGRALGFAYLDYSGSQVAGIAEISLNRASGEIKVHNFWCTIDCGVAVQPDNVIAQTESSIVYGLGVTLTELITIKNGVVEQSNFYDYHVPRMKDVPAMHIEVIQTDNHPTGAGQMATPLVRPPSPARWRSSPACGCDTRRFCRSGSRRRWASCAAHVDGAPETARPLCSAGDADIREQRRASAYPAGYYTFPAL